ncbi:MAG: ADP-ribosylglycohydrolase family protein [Pseudonocardiales bacterium]|nr:ADP-ribosylglycohydrolase family protein [Pseudonocardiales bacterium]
MARRRQGSRDGREDGSGNGNDAGRPAGVAPEPMVNRTLELELLTDHVARVAHGGGGHAVLLLGESGVGKSRLSQAAAAEAQRREMTVISVQCLGRGAEPLLPLKDALAAYLGRSGERIRQTLLDAAPRLLDSIPFIGAFLGRIGDSILESRRLRGATMEGVYEELARVLIGISQKHGLLSAVEDLHQADQDTLFFINYLLRKIRSHQVLVVFTIQEEQLSDTPQLADLLARWTAEGYAVLTVVPLERAHVGEYVHMVAALGSVADEALVDRLFRLTGGNPFFLKETLALLAPRKDEQRGDVVEIPPRVEAVLRRRLARADPTTRRFLDAAAVVAETAQSIEAIAYVMDADPGTAIRALSAAVELQLMRESPRGEIGFVHSLMQRAVYGEIGANYRRFLHGRAADWCEQAGQFAAAAFHFERAERVADMIRTALQAAERAEQAGMYHSALLLYQKVRPHLALEEIGPLLGNAMITLGNWDQTQEILEALPPSDGRVRLLRSQLRFVRGDFCGARDEASAALEASHVDRIEVLIRLADIELYRGRFPDAQRYVQQALTEAERSGSLPQRARCLGELGAIAFFGGGLTRGGFLFTRALALVTGMPEDERDLRLQAVLLGNLGNVAEARGDDWASAQRLHGEALRVRREIADARGALHNLHALGRCQIALGDQEAGLALYAEAERLAADLGETLERAKISHSRAELALREGDGPAAYRLASAAYDTFTASQTHYDITHTQLTLSAAAAASGRERESVEHGAAARRSIQSRGYGLLVHLYPVLAYPPADRIAAAMTGYACGDALGVPWEGSSPAPASPAQIEALPAREGGQRGATSDDTALTVLVAQHLAARGGAADGQVFLRALAATAGSIPGLGPSTTRAIEHFRATGTPLTSGGGEATNGASMRALPIGWATPLDDPDRRRRRTLELSRVTHPDPDALVAACVVAACASWALEGASGALLLTIAIDEEAQARSVCAAGDRLGVLLAALLAGTWQPPADGISLDPAETVTAALACTRGAVSLRDGLLQAVGMGGDTDTVAAITGGLLGARMTVPEVLAELPWYGAVQLPDPALIAELSSTLAAVRSSAS